MCHKMINKPNLKPTFFPLVFNGKSGIPLPLPPPLSGKSHYFSKPFPLDNYLRKKIIKIDKKKAQLEVPHFFSILLKIQGPRTEIKLRERNYISPTSREKIKYSVLHCFHLDKNQDV